MTPERQMWWGHVLMLIGAALAVLAIVLRHLGH